jgi:DNA-binding sugar fermentation-stimulating protein
MVKKKCRTERIREHLERLRQEHVPLSEYKGAVMMLVMLGSYKYVDAIDMIDAYKEELMSYAGENPEIL